MKENKKIFFAILVVVMIITVVFGATYAYWTWVTNNSQRTTVSFVTTAPESDMYANLTGNGAGTTSLKPTTCANGIKKTVQIKYKNNTVQPATITATLSVTSFTFRSASYKPTAGDNGDLKYIKYALTTSSDSCDTGVQKSGDFRGLTIPDTGTSASGLPTALFSQTISVNANTTTEQTATYYLYIWLDSSYTHENEGDVNSDPLQGLSFTTGWSGTIAQNNS